MTSTLKSIITVSFLLILISTALYLVTNDESPQSKTNLPDIPQKEAITPLATPLSSETQNEMVVPPDLLQVTPEVILKLAGSNTIGAKLAPALASDYLKKLGAVGTVKKNLNKENEVQVIGFLPTENKVVAIEIQAHGSSTGFKSLIAKDSDIAMSSRSIKQEENLQLLLDSGDMTKPESEHIIALDGLAVIVHPSNPVKQLTVKQLSAIFSGQIKNWSELGGADNVINLYARDDQSGTYDTFNSLVLKKFKKKLAYSSRYESNEVLAQAVGNDVTAIGFTGLAYANPKMILKVSADEGLPAILPKQFSISSEDYALSRRLFLYANTERSDNSHVNDFINLAISKNGQKVVELVDFIPQKITTAFPQVNNSFPLKYQKIAASGKRLSMTFRMRSDRAEIDNKSAQDIEHLVDYLAQESHEKVTLIGFSAGESNNEKADKNRAFIRSRLLAYELKMRGIHNVEIVALGNQLPIDSNGNEIGRYKNNRTEVWLIESDESS